MEAICRLYLNPYFRGKLSAIDFEKVNNYLTKRLQSKSRVDGERLVSQETVLKELTLLRQILKDCVKRKLLLFNVAREVEFRAEKVERVRYLQPDELKQLLEASQDWLKPLILIAVTTGMRRGEILSMRWVDLDIENSRIILPSRLTKSRKLRVVYLNDLALKVLNSQLKASPDREPSGRVFDEDADYVSQTFRKAIAAAGIVDFRFHDLRHSAATLMRLSGAGIDVIASLLGHADLRQAKRYQHLSPEFLLKAVRGLDKTFEGVKGYFSEAEDSEALDSGPGMIN